MLYAHCKNRFDFWEVISTHWFRYYLPLCEISRLVKKSIHCFSILTHPIPWNWRVFPTSSTRSGRSLLFRLFLGPMSRQFLAGQSTWCTQGSQGKEWESKSLLQKLSELQLTSTDFFSTNSYRYRWFSFYFTHPLFSYSRIYATWTPKHNRVLNEAIAAQATALKVDFESPPSV